MPVKWGAAASFLARNADSDSEHSDQEFVDDDGPDTAGHEQRASFASSIAEEQSKDKAKRKFLEVDLIALNSHQKSGFAGAAGRFNRRSRTNWKLGEADTLQQKLTRIVRSRAFVIFIAFVILVNAAYIAIETDLAHGAGALSTPWYPMEVAFNFIFLVELIMRFVATASYRVYVKDWGNLFDLTLVTFSSIDCFVVTPFFAGNASFSAFQAVRILRLARIARIFRLFSFFQGLWQLVAGLGGAVTTLLWTWVLLVMLLYIFGIFATRMIGHAYADDEELQTYFGTVPRSMFTLFQVTTTEGWAHIARKAMAKEQWTAMFFWVYMFVTTFAVMNVVVAVIVENTLDQASESREKYKEKQRKVQQQGCLKIYEIFCNADADGNGELTKEEFLAEIQNEEVRKCLEKIGIELKMAESLFSMLDYDESHSLDAYEFVAGMKMVVGPARAKDVLAVECDNVRVSMSVQRKLEAIFKDAEHKMTCVERGVSQMRREVGGLLKVLNIPPTDSELERGSRSSTTHQTLGGSSAGGASPRARASAPSPLAPASPQGWPSSLPLDGLSPIDDAGSDASKDLAMGLPCEPPPIPAAAIHEASKERGDGGPPLPTCDTGVG